MKIKTLASMIIWTAVSLLGCSSLTPDYTVNPVNLSGESPDSGLETMIVLPTANQVNPSIARDSSGNYIVVWLDTRGGVRNVYAHKLSSAGGHVWGDKNLSTEGLVAGTWTQTPKVTCDNSGNFYVLYAQNVGNLRLKKFNSSGALLWNVQVDSSSSPVEWSGYDLAYDRASSLYIIYQLYGPYGGGSLVTKFSTSGSRLFSIRNSGVYNDPDISYGGGYVHISGKYDYYTAYVARMYTTGGNAWTRVIKTYDPIRIGTDYSGNLCVPFTSNYSIYYNKYNTSGTITVNSKLISAVGTYGPDKRAATIAIDSGNNKYITFNDKYNTGGGYDRTLKGQKLNSADTALWTSGGVRYCQLDYIEQYTMDVCLDGAGGLFSAWSDTRYSGLNIVFANGVTSSGTRKWANDLVVSTVQWATSSSSSSSVVSSSSSSVSSIPSSSSSSLMSSSSSSLPASSSSSSVSSVAGSMTWTKAANSPFGKRAYAATVVFNGKIWVIAGYKDGAMANDVWSSPNGTNWTQVTASAAFTKRKSPSVVVFNNRIYLIGGWDNSYNYKNDVWYTTDGATWTQATGAAAFQGRQEHTSVVFAGKMWVIGGRNDYRKNDVWSSADGVTWTQATAAAAFPGTSMHSSVVYNSQMWVIAGSTGTTTGNIWKSGDGANWTQATASPAFGARYGHSSVVYNSKIFTVAGLTSDYKNDVWSSADGVAWTVVNSAAPFGARAFHGSVEFNGSLWVIGGDGPGTVTDIWYGK